MATLPWKEILKTATVVASLAGGLWNKQGGKSKDLVDPEADVKSQLAMLSQRIDQVEAMGVEQARLMQMLADDVQSLARRAAIGYWVGIAGLVVAAIAIAIALTR
jgi:hypothetical protein